MQHRPSSGQPFPFLFAALAFAFAVSLGASNRPDGTQAEAPAAVSLAGIPTASLAGADVPTSSACAVEDVPLLDVFGAQGDTTQRQTSRNGAADGLRLDQTRSHGALASRARRVGIAYLEFALELARARSGLVAYRSTAPPPPLSI
ncbi:MAG TPA: hypothetical protein VF212_07160 [Longimicrobiales bacterium]